MKLTRRKLLKLGASAGAYAAVAPSSTQGWGTRLQEGAVVTKPIPSSGEHVPVIGIGTRDYNTEASSEEMKRFQDTMTAFIEHGGTIFDTAAGYGRSTSETVLGSLADDLGLADTIFWATKVDRAPKDEGIARMEDSFDKLHDDVIDLMQVHNLRGTSTQLATIREWQEEGRIRYSGVTTSSARQYEAMVQTIRTEKINFVQVDYSLANRGAAEEILPLCAERGIATLINLPFGRGRLFQAVDGHVLPDFATEWCDSWGQFFLKYVVSHPAVTTAIPGTTKPHHAIDNMGAARGWMPDAKMRSRMETWFDAL